MSQAVSVESPNSTSPSQSINPVLQAALSSIDVQLEEELSRYRRQKAGRPVTPTYSLGSYQTRKSIDLISLEPIANTGKTPLDIASGSAVNPATLSQSFSGVTTEQPVAQGGLNSYAASTTENLSFNLNKTTQAPPADSNGATTTPPLKPQPAQANLVYPNTPAIEPDDYLASSEHLLRSLAEEEAQASQQRSFVSNVINPLNMGLLLLMLLASATVGYIIVNPSIITSLGIDKVWKSKASSVAPTPALTTVATTPTTVATAASNQPISSPIPNGPNLASEEFVELNLNTLSNLKTTSNTKKPTPSTPVAVTPAPAPVPPVSVPNQAMPNSSNLASAILPPGLQPAPGVNSLPLGSQAPVPYPGYGSAQIPVPYQVPQFQQNQQIYPNSAQVATRPQPSKDIYYVLTNNSESTLKLARKILSNSYTRNFPQGSRIVLGTYNKRPQAQVLVDRLQKQGISAWVYQP